MFRGVIPLCLDFIQIFRGSPYNVTSSGSGPRQFGPFLRKTRGHAVAQLVEALRYKPERSIRHGVTGIFH
jgi:hypothetical protein